MTGGAVELCQSTFAGSANPETGLWRAVIMQALLDMRSQSNKPEAKRDRQEAILWFRRGQTDYEVTFDMACDLADLDPQWVFEQGIAASRRNFQWRKERQGHQPAWAVAEIEAAGESERFFLKPYEPEPMKRQVRSFCKWPVMRKRDTRQLSFFGGMGYSGAGLTL